MVINDVVFNCEIEDIIAELRAELAKANVSLFQDVKDGPLNVMVTCPYHKGGKERKPSAGIRKTDGMFHCFTCGEVRTLPEMISNVLGYDDMGAHGFNWLLQHFATLDVEVRKDVVLDFTRDCVRPAQPSLVGEKELESYRVYHPYMWKRKMTPGIVELFDVGYDAYTQCLTFPVRNERGETLFIARRSVNTKFFNYPSGVTKPVYGLYELSCLRPYPSEVIICESMIDAITCWVYGKYAVALNGLGDEYQIEQLNKMKNRKFILATDNDERGQRARKYLRQNIKGKIITEYRIPDGKKDINDLTADEFYDLEEFF